MRLLLDACIAESAARALSAAGHDVARTPDPDPGDAAILALAQREGRVTVTADKDFGELAVAQQQPHGGIVRLVDRRLALHAHLLVDVVARHGVALGQGAIVTVERGRVRVRRT